MRSYELMYILDPKLDEDSEKALLGKIDDLMGKEGVEVEKTEPWGKRRLAYAIKGHWEGNYVLSYLKAEPTAISEMERRLRVTDGILRFLTVRMDEHQAKLERRKARASEKDAARKGRRAERVAAEAAKSSSPAPAAEAPPKAADVPKSAAADSAPAPKAADAPKSAPASEAADAPKGAPAPEAADVPDSAPPPQDEKES